MFEKRIFGLGFLLVFSILSASVSATAQTTAAMAQVPSRIHAPVDEAIRVTIPRSIHPLAKAQNDIGPVESNTEFQRMILVLGGSPDQEYQARTLLDSQQTKGSPNYHHWLTPQEFGQRFGPSQQDVSQVTGWLRQRGFAVGTVARSGLWIEFSGTSTQVEAAFQTRMRQYVVNGEQHV